MNYVKEQLNALGETAKALYSELMKIATELEAKKAGKFKAEPL